MHPERARRHAVAAAVADVLLDDDGAELGPEQRPGRADLEAGGVGAVLAHVRGHQPAEAVALLVGGDSAVDRLAARGRFDQRGTVGRGRRQLLLDEGDVPPGVGAEVDRVVVGLTGEAGGWDRHLLGIWFHSLQATSHALQPMHTEVSVKNPTRGLACSP